MLDAFNRKNVRHILGRDDRQRVNNQNEDAITSMVFSPLKFMRPEEAVKCLRYALGSEEFGGALGRGNVQFVSVGLWPAQLSAQSIMVDRKTRAEPDLVVELCFRDDTRLVIVGEMKWDMDPSPAQLQQQLDRQIKAIKAKGKARQVYSFAILKRRRSKFNTSEVVLTWKDVRRKLKRHLEHHQASTAASTIWAREVDEFLGKVEQHVFEGFHSDYAGLPKIGSKPIFFKRQSRSGDRTSMLRIRQLSSGDRS